MRPRELHYARKFNLGNYESEEIGLVVQLDQVEDLDEAFKTLKAQVFRLHGDGELMEEAKVQVDMGKITDVFPADLRSILYFEQSEDYYVIKPREYLGSDNFGKMAAIVKDQLNGEYISAGKDSHFRVPREGHKPVQEPTHATTSFDPEDLMKHAWKKIGDKEYSRGSLSWGWDFKSEFQDATILALDKGPITIEGYEFTTKDKWVQSRKVK